MILYNFRHRGSYEYDKFVLNIFQFHNEVVLLHGQIFQEGSDEKSNLVAMSESLDRYFDEATGENSLSNKIYETYLHID